VFLQRLVSHPVACLLPAVSAFLGWKEDICSVVHNEVAPFAPPEPAAAGDADEPLQALTSGALTSGAVTSGAVTAEGATQLEQQLRATRVVLKRMQRRQQEEGMDYLELAQVKLGRG